jgi:hypothetical protein
MTTGQMLITVAAMLLLSLLILRVGSTTIVNQDSMQTSKFGVLAVSIAASILEEATMKSFDENANTDPRTYFSNVNELTLNGSLGLDAGENPDSTKTFDDFDDFNNYTTTYDNLGSAVFNVTCQINYVDPAVGGLITANRTWHKMLTVRITSPSIVKPGTNEMQEFVFRKVFSYFYFQ